MPKMLFLYLVKVYMHYQVDWLRSLERISLTVSKPNLLQKLRKTIWKTLYSTNHSLKDQIKFLESLLQRFLKYDENIVDLNNVQ